MALIIILSVIAALLAIGGYQLVVHKYYWGPEGPPKFDEQSTKDDKD